MDITEKQLMAYIDGKAGPELRAAVEAAIAWDPGLRRRVEAHRRLRGSMGAAFAELAPELLSAARGEPEGSRASHPAEIVDLAAVRARKAVHKTAPRPRPAWLQWSALAACLAIGVILARGLAGFEVGALVADRRGTLTAGGALAQALDQQVAGAAGAPDRPVKVGLSFRSSDRMLCRTFQVMRADGLAGIACRAPDGWRVRMAATNPLPARAAGRYHTAAPAIPPAVSATIDAMIVGAPLDAQGEAAAKARGWKD